MAAPRRGRDRIVFLDDVDDDEKPLLMAGCAAYVLPSKPRPEFVETFGIALVEKMLAGGGPVITTDTGGIGEAVGDTALIVPAGDPDAIAAALDRAVLGCPPPNARTGSGGPGRTRCSSTGLRSSTGYSRRRPRPARSGCPTRRSARTGSDRWRRRGAVRHRNLDPVPRARQVCARVTGYGAAW